VTLRLRPLVVALSVLACTGVAPASAAAHGRPLHSKRCGRTYARAALVGVHAPRACSQERPRPRAATHAAKTSATATIATVLATPCQNTQITPEPANIALANAAVLCLINQERAQHDEQPLLIAPDLQRAAEEHAQELVADDYFAHVSPSGESPVTRIKDDGYAPSPSDGYVLGENLAWGTLGLSTPESIVQAWIASPGHLANILEGQYRQTGVAVVPSVPPSLADGQTGATYAQEFGVILS